MKCKIYGGSQTSFFVTVEDYYLTGDVFDLIKCEECVLRLKIGPK